ncbi:cupin domain-containing protein [Candidatus Nitrosotenuis uzonensis]|uniref:Cupin 2 conserved barrel domain protein n=1 Tax=Candidatus Nitrosotenuis uzonensis TaxID=1407055 RepID=V6ATN3_9ARCH|nr:cupin domain-containing protein [Candidatus Nitrosotenuis uzonensis]CDI05890.1 Cupin 2 conserved barrel domain protein [Candidatus Nitrosotenuis uzonensis]
MKLEFDTKQYIGKIKESSNYFHTFINRDNIAAGILVLEPGQEDTQTPHDSDEIYYVVRGDGFLRINNKEYRVSEGMAYYVQKQVPHKFFGNKMDLVVVYFFSGPDL